MDRRELLQSLAAALVIGSAQRALGINAQKQPDNQGKKKGLLVGPDENRNRAGFEIGNGHCIISGNDNGGALSIFGPSRPFHRPATTPNTNMESGSRSARGIPLHVHYEQDEYWFVFEGELLVQVGDKRIHAKAGDLVMGPRGVPHSPRWLHAVAVTIFQPAGTMEEFFHELAVAQQKLGGQMPDHDALATLFKAHGMELLGPPVQP